MVAHVPVHHDGVLEAELVAGEGNSQVLLDALADDAGAGDVDGVLLQVGGGAAGDGADLIVDDDVQTGEAGDEALAQAGAHAAAGEDGAAVGLDLQVAGLLQMGGDRAVHDDRAQLAAALTQLLLGGNDVAGRQVVGGGGSGGAGLVHGVGAEDAAAGDVAEQAVQLGGEGGGLRFVDGRGQLVADVAEGVGDAGAQLGDVVHAVGKAAAQDGHHLLVGAQRLRGQVAGAGGAPAVAGVDALDRRGDRVELGDADPGAAGAYVEGAITRDDAALHEAGLLEDALGEVAGELRAGDHRGQEGPTHVLKCHCWKCGVYRELPAACFGLHGAGEVRVFLLQT